MAAARLTLRRLPSHVRTLCACVLILAWLRCAFAVSDTDLKAAYLANFAALVSWPASAFDGPQAPIVIGVAGDDSVADQIERRLGNRRAKGRPILVRRVSVNDGGAMRECHVLYVANIDRGRLDLVLREVQGAPVLTVSDADNFVRRGGIIAFEMQDATVRFTANNRSAMNSGIMLGSDVLRLAREVIR